MTDDVTALAPPVTGALSPSRASDFKTCPLLYRFRAIDRIPERPTRDQVKGTLVHAVLEHLFDLPARRRVYETAAAMVEPRWAALTEREPELAALFADADAAGDELADWLGSARALLASYFAMEDPRRLEPAARESYVRTVLDDGLELRGYIDRLDVAPNGDVRVVDYKTGRSPGAVFEGKAMFQLKFYALVLWRERGVVPRELRLMYLGDRDILVYRPELDELRRFERTVVAVWRAIERATAERDFRPNPSRLCDWCDHHALCPAKGGTLPPFPDPVPVPGSARGGAPQAG